MAGEGCRSSHLHNRHRIRCGEQQMGIPDVKLSWCLEAYPDCFVRCSSSD